MRSGSVVREIRESGCALTCLEGGRKIDVVMDAEDLERGKGEIGTLPFADRDAGRTGVTLLARAEEEATLRSLDVLVIPTAVVSR